MNVGTIIRSSRYLSFLFKSLYICFFIVYSYLVCDHDFSKWGLRLPGMIMLKVAPIIQLARIRTWKVENRNRKKVILRNLQISNSWCNFHYHLIRENLFHIQIQLEKKKKQTKIRIKWSWKCELKLGWHFETYSGWWILWFIYL